MVVLRSGKRGQSSFDKVVLKSEKRQREWSSSDWASLPEGIVDFNPQPINPTLRLSPLRDRMHAMVLCCRPSKGSPSQTTLQAVSKSHLLSPLLYTASPPFLFALWMNVRVSFCF
ncbi:hypothetical protein RHMOL_Rhmol08G0296100 [Rhododendron molle]|uniref:Uncharacterized protein n=1 Tax=Rhododendron molle TaxID=49168 RepID=A0ACC0MV27_RHOML|nr:hypothetical protein RHMOL_Rhmol08G0296100 [Rhododendron molle]